VWITEDFSKGVGVHQGSALNPYLFIFFSNGRSYKGWCLLMIVLVGKNLEDVNNRLDERTLDLEGKGLWTNRSKTKYIEYEFGGRNQKVDGTKRDNGNKR